MDKLLLPMTQIGSSQLAIKLLFIVLICSLKICEQKCDAATEVKRKYRLLRYKLRFFMLLRG